MSPMQEAKAGRGTRRALPLTLMTQYVGKPLPKPIRQSVATT
jgi:hypothetical protein